MSGERVLGMVGDGTWCPREWTAEHLDGEMPDEWLPPDLTGTAAGQFRCYRIRRVLAGVSPGLVPVDLYCTRRPGHAGRHAAGNGARVVAVWEQT